MAEISQLTRQVPSVRVFPVQPNSLGIRGAGNGLQFALVGNDRKALGDAAVKIIDEMQQGSALPAAAALRRPDAAAACRRHRPRARLRPRHRHHRACQHHAGDARRQRCRRRLHRRPQLWREAGLDHQPDQRSDRPGEHLPEDGRRPLRADVDHRHADRARRAAIADARAAAAVGGHHLEPARQFRARRRAAAAPRRSPRRCCRPAAASCRWPKPRRWAKPTAP